MDRMHGRIFRELVMRNHVAWRLVYDRSPTRPARRFIRRNVPAQMGGQFRHTVRAHRRQARVQEASRARTSSSAPSRIIASKRVAIAARNASRGGSRRMAAEPPRSRSPGGLCQAARPMPVPRQTSQARAMRWLSLGSDGRRWRGSTRPGGHAARPDLVPPANARASSRAASPVPGFGQAIGQCREIHPRAAGQDRQPPAPRGCMAASAPPPPGHAAGLRRGAHAVQAMGHPGFLLRRGAGGQHAEFAIDLHGVAVSRRRRVARPASWRAPIPLAVGPATIRAVGCSRWALFVTCHRAPVLARVRPT